MPLSFRQSAGFLIYRSYTGTLTEFTGACRSSAEVCMGPGGATLPSRLFTVPFRLFPVPRRSLPVLRGDSRCIPEVLNILTFPVEPRFSTVHSGRPNGAPVHTGRIPVHPGISRITHRGSAVIIVRLGLYPDKELCTDCVLCLT
ncbi:hypothetical protein DPMN_163148 [Dreissena polymorpha]|uniref:Uncharacterized protein n=1 Tax=Dreissena polymorpha TaxID=45954 RepID=A0A9D4ERJ1_DREPO|nr:hypothetical protein DPMN_163148 [Dreissena polymorpha]